MLTAAQYVVAYTVFLSVFFGLIGLVLLLALVRSCRVVQQGTALVVERCGRFHRRCDGGFHCLVPFVDRARPVVWRSTDVFSTSRSYSGGHTQETKIYQTLSDVIDLRETIMDFPDQPVVTRDNVELQVHPMLLYRLVDPVRVAYETYDLPHAVEKLVQTTLRSIIGEMGLDDTLSSREEIERSLKSKISRVAFDWGLQINSIEILEITPTLHIQTAMHQQLSAERIRRAAIVSADGQREKMRLEAEGSSQSAVAIATGEKAVALTRAEGEAEKRRLLARAEADSVRIVASALTEYGVDPTTYIMGIKYIDAITGIATAAGSRAIYFPYTTDLGAAISTSTSSGAAVRAR